MFRRVDQSRFLARLLERTSNLLARQRGLPVVIGILLVVVGFIFQTIDVFSENQAFALAGVVTHNLGVLIALIGLVLANPLGK